MGLRYVDVDGVCEVLFGVGEEGLVADDACGGDTGVTYISMSIVFL